MYLHRIPAHKDLVKIVVTNNPSRLAALYHTDPPSPLDHTRFYPENHMTGNEMINYVAEVQPGVVIVTGSLFLFREFNMSRRRDIMYNSIQFSSKSEHACITSTTCAEAVDLEILDRELEQSERYLKYQPK